MGGLVGWVDFRGGLAGQEKLLRRMTATLAHRGPDGQDVWLSDHAGLGHCHLAVDEAQGAAQPMCLDAGDGEALVAGVQTGALYNHEELRRDLEQRGSRFSGRSATEVLLRAYRQWGADVVDRLEGMFAFAIWDAGRRRLLLGRDRFGMKPLYYHALPGGLLFASEPKGIMAHPGFTPRLDLDRLPMVLQPRLALPGETPLAGLQELPAAHLLTVTGAGTATRRYWRLVSEPHGDDFAATAGRVRGLLEDSVARQVGAGAALGAMLSGGIDSTSVAALASATRWRARPDASLSTFCLRFGGDAAHFQPTELRPDVDAPFAAEAAAFLGCRHESVTADASDLLAVIPATRRARDLPGWGQFDASMYLLFRQMRRDCKVVLTGEAADEVFGGYPHFFKPEVLKAPGFPWMGDGPKLSACLSPELTARLDPVADEAARLDAVLADVPRLAGEDPAEARMREVLYCGMAGPLSVILDRKDRMSMAHGLEVRAPFCDHQLVQYVWNVPWAMKARGGVKGLLKAAVRDLLPESTLTRKKSAYPHVQDPAYDRALLREAHRLANDPGSVIAGLFDTGRLNGLIAAVGHDPAGAMRARAFPGGSSAPHLLIQLVELGRWVEDYRVSLG